MIKQWWYAPYTLQPLTAADWLKNRRGALLRIDFEDGLRGYADCHPWVTCGDEPLESQLETLACGSETMLLKQSVFFARLDAEARDARISLFADCEIPESHWLMTDDPSVMRGAGEGFRYFKVKQACDMRHLLGKLPRDSLLRPDFNSLLSKAEFERFLDLHDGLLHRFDFFEDPIPYDEKEWHALQKKYGISLACDRHSYRALGCPDSARVVVIKSAVQRIDALPLAQRVIVTSYLDHPLGQAAAAYEAKRLGCREVCGLNSHRVYASTPFSLQLSQWGPQFSTPKGTGLGFDMQLEEIQWRKFELSRECGGSI